MRAALLLLVIVLIAYFAGGGWGAIPSALVAWGTILLAYATFSLVRHSKEQEDRQRQEEQAREKRDRKERLLNEISDWLIADTNFRMHFTSWETERFLSESLIIINSLQNLYVKGISLARIIRAEWPELAKNIDEIVSYIDEIIDALLKDEINPKEKHAVVVLLQNKLIKPAGEAFRIVDGLRASLL